MNATSKHSDITLRNQLSLPLGISFKHFFVLSILSLTWGCGKSVYSEKVTKYYDEKVKGDDPDSDTPDTFELNSVSEGLHAPNGWSVHPILVHVDETFDEHQVSAIDKVLQTYNSVVGYELLVVGERIPPRETGSGLYDYFESTNAEVIKVYRREKWAGTEKPKYVLATTVWSNPINDSNTMTYSEIHFNAEFYYFVDALQDGIVAKDDREIADMETLALHEFGHALGMTHRQVSTDKNSIMHSSVFIGPGMANRQLSEMDIKLMRFVYSR
jgi:hypothetical protein